MISLGDSLLPSRSVSPSHSVSTSEDSFSTTLFSASTVPDIVITSSTPTAVKGMRYNPKTFRWEGNEEAVNNFEPIPVTTPPRPALITNVSQSKNIQVVGGMVFDPARMCWLKMSQESEDEADPFEGIDDLEEPSADGDANGSSLGNLGEFVVGEEFDVGPQFVRKQRIEEESWRQMVDGWLIHNHDAIDHRRDWELRDMILQSTPTSERP